MWGAAVALLLALTTPPTPFRRKEAQGSPATPDLWLLQAPAHWVYPALLLGWCTKALPFLGWSRLPPWVGIAVERCTSTLGSDLQEQARYLVRFHSPHGRAWHQCLDILFKSGNTLLRTLPLLSWMTPSTFFLGWLFLSAPLGTWALRRVQKLAHIKMIKPV